MTTHHPELGTLSDFASGSLAVAEAVCIGVHLHHCPSCQKQVDSLNQLGGELLETAQPVSIDSGLLEKVLAKVESPKQAAHSVASVSERETKNAELPAIPALQKLIPEDLQSLKWRRLGADLEIARLAATDHSHKLSLYRIQPGGKIGEHGHYGSEMTTVLKGAFSDGSGIYAEGDFRFCDLEDVHRPIATQNGECLCLSAEVAPIRFTGWPEKILNPILRFEQLLAR